MFSFVRNLVGVKTDQAVNGAVAALVRWDPQSATEAELRTMEQHLDELGRRVAEARIGFDREQREADAITQLSRQRMTAAEQLHQRAEAEADPARKAEVEPEFAAVSLPTEAMKRSARTPRVTRIQSVQRVMFEA